MTSLKTKLFVIITLIVALIVSASSLITLNQQQGAMTGIAQRNVDILTETVKGSITDAMLSGNSRDISRILSQIADQKLIRTLRIIDESGKVLNSANKDEIGKTAFSKALLAYKRHLPVSTRLVDNQFVSISPILNSPSCSVCHDPATKVLGLLEIETPAEYLQSFLSDSKRHIFFTAAIIILLLTISIFFFLVKNLDNPLKALISSMQQVEEGMFFPSPVFTSSREMNQLSTHFNRMVKRLHLLMDSAVRNEGELVRAQEKLAHHHEIHIMNEQLEVQLTEIEALNISLEERIEEIEEANRTIASLAREQQQSYLSTIQSLVSAIEASDSYTKGHSERVRHYSMILAGSLGLSAERLRILERAAMLHDIGKIGIDFAILNKIGPLSPQERDRLREHPAIGMKILEPITFLDDVRTCIGQHHERYDGLGYPGRKGADDLLLESQILAIADAYDAMTSNRPYRKAMPASKAVEELLKNAGTQFNPELVNCFAAELAKTDVWQPVEKQHPVQIPSITLSA